VVTKHAAEAFERRVAAYLEMDDSGIVAELNHHYNTQGGYYVQAKLFDWRALTEAIRRSDLYTSEINFIGGIISMESGPFRLEDKKIVIVRDQ